jgi:drug/metabolite transporter (DMT)-like permease
VLAVIFTGETIHPLQLLGVALIVGGVVLVVTS